MNRFRGRSGAGSVPAHGMAPQNLSPDKHVDVCVESDEDRGSTPLASSLRSQRSKSEGCHAGAKRRRADCDHAVQALRDYGLAGQPSSMNDAERYGSLLLRLHTGQRSEQ